MMQDYAQYLQFDRQIRQLTLSGQQQAAIALSTGRDPGQFQWVFDQLLEAAIITAAIALLILFGLRPRLREYFT